MADIHILSGNWNEGNKFVSKDVVFHFAIPVGKQVAAASDDPELIAFVSEVPDLATNDPTEVAAIQAGTVVEVRSSINFHLSTSEADRLAMLRAQYAAMQSQVENDYEARYYNYLQTFTKE